MSADAVPPGPCEQSGEVSLIFVDLTLTSSALLPLSVQIRGNDNLTGIIGNSDLAKIPSLCNLKVGVGPTHIEKSKKKP